MKQLKSVDIKNTLSIFTIMLLSGLLSTLSLLGMYKFKLIPATLHEALIWLFIPIILFIVFSTCIMIIKSNNILKLSNIKRLTKLPSLDSRQSIIENAPLILYRDTFLTIVAVLEARDPYTSNHSERVSQMALRFCLQHNMPILQTQMIEMTAIVHDIGKIGIEDNILRKSGKLDDAEWEEMRNHPGIGAGILLKAGKQLKNVAESVISHHERWDGGGYPKGLRGEEIPYPARVIAICDSVDAMLSDRVYRKAMNKENCIEELLKGKGNRYQPELIDEFLEHWDNIVGDLYLESQNINLFFTVT